MSGHYSTLLKCAGCSALGAITWDLVEHDAVQDRAFVALAGDFYLDERRVPGSRRMIVCSQCDAIYGPVPVNALPATVASKM